MSVEIIAADLGLDLFKVDLSCVVSKYIGETEKNLSHVFEAAESANGILFFDEADALFGRRTEVKDSHDRYANIEVNYLLQRMEAYEGVVVLATNFKSNLDPAFTRRLHHVVEFPFPDEADRGRIWRKVFPAEAPMAEDVDFGFLARQLHFAGGNIRNVALNAAFLAATNGGRIGMKHLVLAARREFQKMGRTWSKSDFGRYYPWVVAAGAPADGRG
jgi:SpoVK/Ycf46/Vps4 family AAA+-type ATPase